jgi:hypothetical protein
MRRLKKLNYTSSGLNGIITINLPTNVVLFAIHFVLTAGACVIANITNVLNQVNGEPVLPYVLGTDIDEFNKRYDFSPMVNNAILSHYFEDITLIDKARRLRTAHWGLSTDLFQMTVAGATTPSFDVYVEYDDLSTAPKNIMPNITRWTRYSPTLAAAKETNFNLFDYGDSNFQFFKQFIVKAPAGTISYARLEWGPNNDKIFDRPATLNDQVTANFVKWTGITKGAYWSFVIDTHETGWPEELDSVAAGLRTGDQNINLFLIDNTAEQVEIFVLTRGTPKAPPTQVAA